MATRTPREVPDPPKPTGRTFQLVARLIQRRKDLGLTQEDVANRLVDYSARLAEQNGEDPRWLSLSKQVVWQWENMFRPPGEEVPEKLKRTRLNMPMSTYGMWARVLGLRMFVDYVDANDEGEHVFLQPDIAKMARRLNGLPIRHRRAILDIVDDLWKVYREDHAVPPRWQDYSPKAADAGHMVAAAWDRLDPTIQRVILTAAELEAPPEPEEKP